MAIGTALFWFGISALLIVALLGGRATIKPGTITVNTKGLLDHLRRASTQKGGKGTHINAQQLAARRPISRVLWVDDHPINNQEERLAFADYGVFCDSYTNNAEALAAFQSAAYEIVLSDIGRDGGEESGLRLLESIRAHNPEVPFGFYTFGIDAEIRKAALQAGASAIVELPDELFNFVVGALAARHGTKRSRKRATRNP